MSYNIGTVDGKVKAFDMWGDETGPKTPVEGVAYFFLYDCKIDNNLTALSGDILEYTSEGWKEWTGDIWAPLDDLIDRE